MEDFTLNALPSIRENISVHHHEAPQNANIDEIDSDEDEHYYDSADEGFSFGISTVDNFDRTLDLTADEIFHHGHLLPLHSVSKHAPSREDDTDTDTSPIQQEAPVEFFDMPKKSPGSPIKSWSTGSTRRRNPFHEFLFGTRSRSDGKEKLGFVEKGSSASVDGKKKKEKGKGKGGKGKGKATNKDANKSDYAKNGGKEIVKARGKDVLARRRSFLPYIGFFGGGPMHGFSKTILF